MPCDDLCQTMHVVPNCAVLGDAVVLCSAVPCRAIPGHCVPLVPQCH